MAIVWELGFVGISKPGLLLLIAYRLLAFKVIMELGERTRNRESPNLTKLTVLTKNKCFFKQCSLDCCKVLVSLQNSVKLILTICAGVLTAFKMKQIFGNPCPIITDVLL